MRLKTSVTSLFVVLLAVFMAGLVVACNDSDNDFVQQPTPAPQVDDSLPALPSDEDDGLETGDIDEDDLFLEEGAFEPLSTFLSKDPFIPQAVPKTESSSTTVAPVPIPVGSSTLSTVRPPVTVGPTPTYTYPTTTPVTTTPTSSTTTLPPHAHSLTVLAIATMGSETIVTFSVDGTTYKDKIVGDVVSTTWGQIKVVDIDLQSKVVTLLHGSETLVIPVGQTTYE